ncbi:hypothetical protein CDD82_7435 [Ophiocordyceps australis]|uniref:YTH domain-containing protein n=1 Tax=Ophiocordyceps australis TaxID=1399860 RepID=A0A2C5YMC3_9HYPO|nr:hypothetical protein CDD82_7435 [Ophiocordyceps australis]
MGDVPVHSASEAAQVSLAGVDAKQKPKQPATIASSHQAFASQLDMASQQTHQGSYQAPPLGGYRPGQYPPPPAHRYMSPIMTQMPHMAQYGAPPMAYYMHQAPMSPYYAAGHGPPSHMPSPRHNMAYYASHVVMGQAQPGFYYQQPAHEYSMPPQPQPMLVAADVSPRPPDAPDAPPPAHGYSCLGDSNGTGPDQGHDGHKTVRGPPRKPRQSGKQTAAGTDRCQRPPETYIAAAGHAIWIGNLPPNTDLMSLVHHVCKETTGLESVFLISKSNCAFANFKDDKTCLAAQQTLHDSRYETVRLVSRLRKSTVEGVAGLTAPTGPALPPGDSTRGASPNSTSSSCLSPPAKPKASAAVVDGHAHQDRFFILKSLTLEDLELSVQTGIWATQSHNEDTLNNAFKKYDNVYLVFSANKSGEYFGYARMTSEVNKDPEAAIEFAPKSQAASALQLPRAIATEATQHAPRGTIIDDSARGTIFWEAERDECDTASENASDVSSNRSCEPDQGTKTWGKPFKLEWLSVTRLPFYRTRGLRNPWNSNREVKIARDGTELEPSVGRKLIGLFNRIQSPGLASSMMRPPVAAMHLMAPI